MLNIRSLTKLSGLIAASLLTGIASQVHATTLLEIYDRAAQNDPQIRAADANRLATREAHPQAWAQLLPNISANANWSSVACSANSAACAAVGFPTGPQPTDAYTKRGGSFSLDAEERINLPLMLRNLKHTDYVLAQADITYHAAEQDLAVRVANAYFNVLSAQDVLTSSQASLAAFNKQLEQQEKRFEVGLSANTDVQEARAARDAASATVISSKQALASAQEQLRVIAGTFVDKLAAPVDDMPLIMPEPQNEEDWVKKALDGNLNLAAARVSLDMATYDLGTTKTYRYPSLTLGASYNNNKTFNDFDTSNGIHSWNGTIVSVGISVPLFSGGMISSQIRQSTYLQRAARENVELATRQTDSGARNAFLGMESAIALVKANKQAYESAKLALQATEAGFDVGTRTTIDVLNSRKALLTAEVQYEQSRYQYITQLITLKQTSGELSRADLELINSWLTK
ncbi:MAG TPA: TolC family outer membrane protein [Steroidobacteraceae bacterium]|nr:TolC family outer membrane protein [Steroidobacteraceae bacterium]